MWIGKFKYEDAAIGAMSEEAALRKELEELRAEVERLKQQQESEGDAASAGGGDMRQDGVSRRGFLKKMGVGAAGLGALAIAPASALTFSTDDDVLFRGGNLDAGGGNIIKAAEIRAEDVRNTRTVSINGTEVHIGHRVITSTLPVSDIQDSDKITIREGDLYQRVEGT